MFRAMAHPVSPESQALVDAWVEANEAVHAAAGAVQEAQRCQVAALNTLRAKAVTRDAAMEAALEAPEAAAEIRARMVAEREARPREGR